MILSAIVDWNLESNAAPKIRLTVDVHPCGPIGSLKFEPKSVLNCRYYLAKVGNFGKCFFEGSSSQNVSKNKITITLIDGSKKPLFNPYEPDEGSINLVYETKYCEVEYKLPGQTEVWYSCLVEINEVLPHLRADVSFKQDEKGNYIPRIGKLNWRESKILMRET